VLLLGLGWLVTNSLSAAEFSTTDLHPDITAALRHDHAAPGEIIKARPGPWGDLDMTPVLLEPPHSIIGADAQAAGDLSWTFTGIPAGQVESLLQNAGITGGTLTELMATRETDAADGTVILHPTDAILLGMDPATRYRVYSLLRGSSTNKFYRYPFQISHLFTDEWFRDAILSDATRELIRPLIYTHGEMTYFSDVRFVISKIPQAAERLTFFAALLRQSTLMVRLNACQGADMDAMIAYWGANGRTGEVGPLLQALSRNNVAWPVDIMVLLPAFPRRALMTYDSAGDGKFRDCGWTALNFFNDKPDDTMLDPDTQARVLQNDYVSVVSGFLPGDIILIRNGDGKIVHICNYIADNIVFTKNGGHKAQPWTLSTLEEVVEYYTVGDDICSVLFLRRSDASRKQPVLNAKRTD